MMKGRLFDLWAMRCSSSSRRSIAQSASTAPTASQGHDWLNRLRPLACLTVVISSFLGLAWLAWCACAAGGGDVMVPATRPHPGQPCIIQTATTARPALGEPVIRSTHISKKRKSKLVNSILEHSPRPSNFFLGILLCARPRRRLLKGGFQPPSHHAQAAAPSRFCCRCHCFPSRLLPPPVAQQTQKIAS